MVNNSCLLPAEHKAASSILCVLIKDAEMALNTTVNLEILLAPPQVASSHHCCWVYKLTLCIVYCITHALYHSVNKGHIHAGAGLGAATKMRAPPPMGTHFCFQHAYCLMMHMLVNLFVGQIAINKKLSCPRHSTTLCSIIWGSGTPLLGNLSSVG